MIIGQLFIILIFITLAYTSPKRHECPNAAIELFYRYLNCTPTNLKCPQSYICPELEKPEAGNCFSNGFVYKPGENIPSDNPCRFCKCSENGVVSCAISEFCPRLMPSQIENECYYGYESDTCCPQIICPEKKDNPKTCTLDGKTYRLYERFYVGCKQCICNEKFDSNDPMKNCKDITCGYDDEKIQQGCAVVTGEKACCPYFYHCPTTKKIREEICSFKVDAGICEETIPSFYYDPLSSSCKSFNYTGCAGGQNRFSTEQECLTYCQTEDEIEPKQEGTCYFNGKNYQVSQLVATEDAYIECKCVTPPYIQCITK